MVDRVVDLVVDCVLDVFGTAWKESRTNQNPVQKGQIFAQFENLLCFLKMSKAETRN